jgi:hypothetical protein
MSSCSLTCCAYSRIAGLFNCWRLEVVFSEDTSRVRKGNASAIMTSIRHLCLNLFQRNSPSLRLSQEGHKNAWGDNYRAKLVLG